MIKCLNCGEEFSYGRKICCHSTYSGIIFNKKRIEHKWNCNIPIHIKMHSKILEEEISDIHIIEIQKPRNYNWNCETSFRIQNQKDLIERDYFLIYE